MRCERCGLDIMKADYFCGACAAPNPRNEEAEARMKKAFLGALEEIGVDVTDAEGANGKAAWEEFERRMWPRE